MQNSSRNLRWDRESDGSSVIFSDGDPILSQSFLGKGLDRRSVIELVGRNGKSDSIIYFDDISDYDFSSYSKGYFPFVRKIQTASRSVEFALSEDDSGIREMVVESPVGNSLFSWESESGYAVRAKERECRVSTPTYEGYDLLAPRISSKHLDDDSFQFMSGAIFARIENGTEIIEVSDFEALKYTRVIGANGTRLRKIERLESGQVETVYKAYLDESGVPIRETRGAFRREYKDGKFHVYKNNKLIRVY